MTLHTRVCSTCRRRKDLAEFYKREQGKTGYRTACKSCTRAMSRKHWHEIPKVVRPPRMFVCQYCGVRQPARALNQKACRDPLCQRELKRDRNHRQRAARTYICIDCGGPAYFRRCDACRATHQAVVEAALATMPERSDLCCGQPLEFGTDPMTGVTLEYCATCGERPVKIVGARHYDQRPDLSEEIAA
jgi:hypothetical protein